MAVDEVSGGAFGVSSGAPIVFFGNEQLAQGLKRTATPVLDALVRGGYNVAAIVLPPEKEARSRSKKVPAILQAAEKYRIPVYYPRKLRDFLPEIQRLRPVLGVLSSYGKIVPASVIEAFPLGILNIHPSLLPKYRGTTPIETALLNGDAETGVSVMGLVPAMDAGSIFAQKVYKVATSDTKQTLYTKLATGGAELLMEVLPSVLSEAARPSAQDEAQATFTAKLDKTMSALKPAERSAADLVNQIRAFAGFPKSKLSLLGLECTILDAHAADTPATELDPVCADGRYLVIDELIPPNSKPMSAAAFLNGYKR